MLSIRFLPDEDDDGQVDLSTTGYDSSVEGLRVRIEQLENSNAWWATEATRYRGYANDRTTPAVDFEVIDTVEFRSNPPRGRALPNKPGVYRPDYLGTLADLDICELTKRTGVREVWMFTQHHGDIEPTESKLSSGQGDISNSHQYDDMPRCDTPYTLYNFNFARSVAEMMHNRGHQLERLYSHHPADRDLFINDFVGGEQYPLGSPTRCGLVHWSPITRVEYVTNGDGVALSDCESWTPAGGPTSSVSCATWFEPAYGQPQCFDDGGLAFYVWWMQNMPGADNGLAHDGRPLTNWWTLTARFEDVEGRHWLTEAP